MILKLEGHSEEEIKALDFTPVKEKHDDEEAADDAVNKKGMTSILCLRPYKVDFLFSDSARVVFYIAHIHIL